MLRSSGTEMPVSRAYFNAPAARRSFVANIPSTSFGHVISRSRFTSSIPGRAKKKRFSSTGKPAAFRASIYPSRFSRELCESVLYRKWTVAIRKDAQDSVRKMSADGARIPRQISRARLEKSYSLIQRPTFFIQQI